MNTLAVGLFAHTPLCDGSRVPREMCISSVEETLQQNFLRALETLAQAYNSCDACADIHRPLQANADHLPRAPHAQDRLPWLALTLLLFTTATLLYLVCCAVQGTWRRLRRKRALGDDDEEEPAFGTEASGEEAGRRQPEQNLDTTVPGPGDLESSDRATARLSTDASAVNTPDKALEHADTAPEVRLRELTNTACKNCKVVAGKKQCFYGLCRDCCVKRKDTLCKCHGTLMPRMKQQIETFTTRIELDLSYCRLHTIPQNIGSLHNLLSLNLSDNNIQFLPDEIGLLTNLEELFLHYNRLETLPASITRLENLAELRLKNNQLKCLPDDIGRLSKLKVLILTNNRIKQLPESIGELTQLQEFAAHANCITSIPSSFCKLKNLSTLYMGENLLRTLPLRFGDLQSLEECDFSRCQLTSIPQSISQLSNLARLWLNENQLTDLPNQWVTMTALCDLFVRENQIAHVPWQLSQMQLANLNLHMNPFSVPNVENFRDYEAVAVGVPTLQELAARRVKTHYKHSWRSINLPESLKLYLESGKVCSLCNSPFFEFWWSRLDFWDLTFNSHVPLYLELCSFKHAKQIDVLYAQHRSNVQAHPSFY